MEKIKKGERENVLFQRKDKGSWLHTVPIPQPGTPQQVDYLTYGYHLGVISNDAEHIQPDCLFRKVKKNDTFCLWLYPHR